MANHCLLPERTSADTDGEVSRLLAKLEASGSNLRILRYVANAPGAFRPFVLFANALLNESRLPRRSIEIVVLRIGRLVEAPYEVAEHVPMARAAGVDDIVIEALVAGTLDLAMLDEPTRLMVEVAERIVVDRTVPGDLWALAVERLGTASTTELVLLVGWFAGMVRSVLDALELAEAL